MAEDDATQDSVSTGIGNFVVDVQVPMAPLLLRDA
jgi:hypothetical protein